MSGEFGLRVRRAALPRRAEEGVTVPQVVGLAWPIAVQMLSFTAMGLVDTLFVGQLGTASLAAVGLGGTVGFLVQAGGIGLVSGTRVAVAQAHGAGRPEVARGAAWSGLRIAATLGVLTPLACVGVGPLLTLLGAEGEVWRIAVPWAQVRILAVPFLLATAAWSGWFQGRGDTRTPMVATLVANAVNILLDPVLIFGWGPFVGGEALGAAAATVAGSAAGLLVLSVAGRASIGQPPGRVERELRRVLELGVPIGVRGLLGVGAFVIFAGLLASVGEVALAAHIVVLRVVSVSFLPGHAVGEAASVLVGQAIGASAPGRARSAWAVSTGVATVGMGLFAGVFLAVPELLLAGFALEPEVQEVAMRLMRIAAAFQLLDAVAMVGLGALSGAGETRFTMVCCVTTAWLVKLPVGFALVVWAELGAAGAWWGLTAEIAVLAVVVVLRVRRAPWAR